MDEKAQYSQSCQSTVCIRLRHRDVVTREDAGGRIFLIGPVITVSEELRGYANLPTVNEFITLLQHIYSHNKYHVRLFY